VCVLVGTLPFLGSCLRRFCSSLFEAYWASTNTINTSSSYCISPRIDIDSWFLFLEHKSLYFSPFDTTSPFESSSSFVIKLHHSTWNPDCTLCIFFTSEPKTKANDSKENKKTQWGLKTDLKLHGLLIDERNKNPLSSKKRTLNQITFKWSEIWYSEWMHATKPEYQVWFKSKLIWYMDAKLTRISHFKT
jgi:hypothetical protein